MNWWKEAFVDPRLFYFIHQERDRNGFYLYKATVAGRQEQIVSVRGVSIPASPIDYFDRMEDPISEWDLSLVDTEVGDYATIFLLRTTPNVEW